MQVRQLVSHTVQVAPVRYHPSSQSVHVAAAEQVLQLVSEQQMLVVLRLSVPLHVRQLVADVVQVKQLALHIVQVVTVR